MSDNMIEKALKEIPNNNTQIDPNLALLHGIMDVMSEKTKLVEKFMSPDELKTQITKSEQTILSSLEMLARNPFPEMITYSPELEPLFKSEELTTYLSRYIALGIAVERKGRIEDKEAIISLSEQDLDLMMRGNRGGNGGGGMI